MLKRFAAEMYRQLSGNSLHLVIWFIQIHGYNSNQDIYILLKSNSFHSGCLPAFVIIPLVTNYTGA